MNKIQDMEIKKLLKELENDINRCAMSEGDAGDNIYFIDKALSTLQLIKKSLGYESKVIKENPKTF